MSRANPNFSYNEKNTKGKKILERSRKLPKITSNIYHTGTTTCIKKDSNEKTKQT